MRLVLAPQYYIFLAMEISFLHHHGYYKTYAIKNGQLIADETRKELEYHINRFKDVHLDYLLK